jgi:Homing endonuclease associated repeat
MTKRQIISALRTYATQLGRTPRCAEFYRHARLSAREVLRHFSTFTRLLKAAGLERGGPGVPISLDQLFPDWASVARKLGKIPAKTDYAAYGRYSIRPFLRRFGAWSAVPGGLREYAIRQKLENEWPDVMKIIGEHLKDRAAGRVFRKGRHCGHPIDGRTIYGRPLLGPFSFTPTNESGVLFTFGAVAHELGFFITHVQTEFPDLEVLREIGPNQCQRQHWELEYESRNFLKHMHPLKQSGCDGIICWINNWPDCPLEVIELRSVVERLARHASEPGPSFDKPCCGF